MKNTATHDGTREGLPTPQLSNSIVLQDTKKRFRKQILDKKLYCDPKVHVHEPTKFKSSKNDCFYPLDACGKMHPSVEAEFLSVKKFTKNVWFEQ